MLVSDAIKALQALSPDEEVVLEWYDLETVAHHLDTTSERLAPLWPTVVDRWNESSYDLLTPLSEVASRVAAAAGVELSDDDAEEAEEDIDEVLAQLQEAHANEFDSYADCDDLTHEDGNCITVVHYLHFVKEWMKDGLSGYDAEEALQTVIALRDETDPRKQLSLAEELIDFPRYYISVDTGNINIHYGTLEQLVNLGEITDIAAAVAEQFAEAANKTQ